MILIDSSEYDVAPYPIVPIATAVAFPRLDPFGEVEMDTGLTCDTSPQIRGAIKSLDGVLDVQEI